MNNLNARPIPRGPIVDKDGNPSRWFRLMLTDLVTRSDKTTTNLGEIQSVAPITGRTEGIATTVGNITPTGQLNSLLNVAADRNTDNIADATGSPLAGGKRGFVALDTNNRLANSFRNTAVNVSGTPTSATLLSNSGATTAIPVAAGVTQFASGTVSNNSGSVDPGVFGTFSVYHDDPTFAGGAVTYVSTTSLPTQVAAEGRMVDGIITSVNGAAKTGGGNTGGTTTGGTGGRGYNTL